MFNVFLLKQIVAVMVVIVVKWAVNWYFMKLINVREIIFR